VKEKEADSIGDSIELNSSSMEAVMIEPLSAYVNNGNREVLSAIPPDAKKILDLGCGGGNNARLFKGSTALWDGVTISPEEAEVARKHYRNVVLYNLENGLPSEGLDTDYDACICSHVIEHIVWPQKLFHDIHAVLRVKTGTLIMAVPNAVHHQIRSKIVRGKFDYRGSGILDVNHVRWYTFRSACELLEKNGFTVTRAWAEGDFPIGRFIRQFLSVHAKVKMNRIACDYFPGFFGYQLLYTAVPR
jgi:SAM-dependent methyltransferase